MRWLVERSIRSVNIGFADGHASTVNKSKIFFNGMSKVDNYGGVMWNPDGPLE